jgi:hypothetical protein
VGVVVGLVVGSCVPSTGVVGICVSAGFVVGVGDGLAVVVGGCVSAGSLVVDMRMPPSGENVQVPLSGQRFACSPSTLLPFSVYQLDSTEGS